jgi:hypothetical protein
VALAALLFARRRRIGTETTALLLGAVLVGDALLAARPLLATTDASVHSAAGPFTGEILRDHPAATSSGTAGSVLDAPAARRLYAPPPATAEWRHRADAAGGAPAHGDREWDDVAVRVAARAEREWLVPDCGLDDGIAHLDPYDALHPPREQLLLGAVGTARLLALTATRFALLPSGREPAGLRRLVHDPNSGLSLFAAEAVAPRLYLAAEVRPAADAVAAARAVADADFVPGRTAVVEGGAPAGTPGSCALDEDRPERLRFHCDAEAPGYAVLADAWFPGWRARVDGREVPILPANVALRAVAVPAGRSTVEMVYRPLGLRAGGAAAVLGLALALWFLALARSRSRTHVSD